MNWIYYVLLALALLGDVLLVVLLVRTRQSARRTGTAEDFVRAMTPVLQEETDLLAEQLRAMQGGNRPRYFGQSAGFLCPAGGKPAPERGGVHRPAGGH